jgi:two-component sensor histidine kinase
MAAETYGPLDIPFSINGIPEMEKFNLTMLEKNYLLYAIKECITNSLKYGNKKQVALKWELKNRLHQITISNGINEAAVPNKNGQGTYNISSRMKKIRGDVKFFPSNEIYTVVLQLNFIK